MPSSKKWLILEKMDKPYSIVRKLGAAQTIPNNIYTLLNLDTIILQRGVVFNLTSDTFIINEDGVYSVFGSCPFVSNGVGQRAIRVLLNGVNAYNQLTSAVLIGGVAQTAMFSAPNVALVAGTTLQFQVYQSSGGNLNTAILGNSPEMSVMKVSDL